MMNGKDWKRWYCGVVHHSRFAHARIGGKIAKKLSFTFIENPAQNSKPVQSEF